jgi:hypothetical protein
MGRWLEFVARLTMASLLASGLLVTPAASSGVAVARSSGCPAATIQRLVGDGSHTCYGSHTLSFRAYVQRPCTDGCGGTDAFVIGPRWLDNWEGSYVLLGSGPRSASIAAFVSPALGRCNAFADLTSCAFHPYKGHWATVRARFNDPISRTCRFADHPPGAGFTKKDAIAECRTKLVVLSVGPVAPETDVAASLADAPARGDQGLPWVLFIVALLLAARCFPSRRLASGPDAGRT